LSCRVVVLQSNYLPWLGYFALIAEADILVVLDSAKYTKNDWRNRNQLLGANGLFWLTVPVHKDSTSKCIYDATVVESRWVHKHLVSLQESLSGLQFADEVLNALRFDYNKFIGQRSLHSINLRLISTLCELMSIRTTIILDYQVATSDLLAFGANPTLRLVEICKTLGASSYLTGPSALRYLELAQFTRAGIKVEIADYSLLPTYKQKYDGFTPNVSVVDFLAAVGTSTAQRFLTTTDFLVTKR